MKRTHTGILALTLLFAGLVQPAPAVSQAAGPVIHLLRPFPGVRNTGPTMEFAVVVDPAPGTAIDATSFRVTAAGAAQIAPLDWSSKFTSLGVIQIFAGGKQAGQAFVATIEEGPDLPLDDYTVTFAVRDLFGTAARPLVKQIRFGLPLDIGDRIQQRYRNPENSTLGDDSFTFDTARQSIRFLAGDSFYDPSTGAPWTETALLQKATGKPDWLPDTAPFADRVAELRAVLDALAWRKLLVSWDSARLIRTGVVTTTVSESAPSGVVQAAENSTRNGAFLAMPGAPPTVTLTSGVHTFTTGDEMQQVLSLYSECAFHCTLVSSSYQSTRTTLRGVVSGSPITTAFPADSVRLVLPRVSALQPFAGSGLPAPADFAVSYGASGSYAWPPSPGSFPIAPSGTFTVSGAVSPTYGTAVLPLDPTIVFPSAASPRAVTTGTIAFQLTKAPVAPPTCTPLCNESLNIPIGWAHGFVADEPYLLYRLAYEPILTVEAIEATQLIQSWRNDVPLVAGKPTVVRGMMRAGPAPVLVGDVTGELLGLRDGAPLGPPLAIVEASKIGGISVNDTINPVSAQIENFLFDLPPSWLTGTLQLSLRVTNHAFRCARDEIDAATGGCLISVTFTPSPRLLVGIVPVAWPAGASSQSMPTAAQLQQIVANLGQQLPLASVEATTLPKLQTDGPPYTEAAFAGINAGLAARRALDCATSVCRDLYLGVIADGPPIGLQGLANPPSRVASVFVQPKTVNNVPERQRPAVHEADHVLGLNHVVCTGAEVTPPGVSPYPYLGGLLDEVNEGREAHRGFDLAALGLIANTFGEFNSQPAELGALTVYEPDGTGDLMSYCQPGWPSDWTNDRVSKILRGIKPASSAAAIAKAVVVSGVIDTATGAGKLFPAYQVDVPGAPPASTGSGYQIQLIGSGGSSTFSFGPADGQDGSLASFAFIHAAPAGLRRIVLLKGGFQIAALDAGAAVPSVAVTAPAGGGQLGPGPIPVSWSASPAGLTFALRYSPDGGANWQTIGENLTVTSTTIDSDALPASVNARFEVIATDGVQSVAAQSGAFSVAPAPPLATITRPGSGRVFGDGQIVSLSGFASSPDGAVTGLQWSSNLAGPLGSGATLEIPASSLPAGTHVIQLTATTPAGATGITTVTIRIVRNRLDLPAALLAEPAAIAASAILGGPAPATRSLALGQTGSGGLRLSVTADQPWLKLQTAGSPAAAVTVSFDTAGLGAGRYAATITIVGDPAGPRIIPVTFTLFAPTHNTIFLPDARRNASP